MNDKYNGDSHRLRAECWSSSGHIYTVRSLFDFDVSSIPPTAKVTNASVNLYSFDQPEFNEDKHYSILTSGPVYRSNASYLQRITSPWDDKEITWNSQPDVTTTNQALLEESEFHLQDYVDKDITALVQDMVSKPDSSYGVMFRLQNETKYSRMVFASSDFGNITHRPNVEISYKIYPTLLKSSSIEKEAVNLKPVKNINVS